LVRYGRKTLLVSTTFALAIINFIVGFALLKSIGPLMIAGVMVFITVFEFGPGPITWLYMAEIMQDKATSIATFMNWGINLLISYFVPILKKKIGDDHVGYIFFFMGAASFIGTAFIAYFMKETKGKTNKEIEDMFNKNTSNMKEDLIQNRSSNFNSEQ
jgi:MFS family permease